jgi:hypothetical protein
MKNLGGKVDLHMSSMPPETIKYFSAWRAEDVMDTVHLVELIVPREERVECCDLKHHTPNTPNVHLVIVIPISHKALRRSVPPGRDILCVRLARVNPLAGTEVS